jgi:hypothetical protein
MYQRSHFTTSALSFVIFYLFEHNHSNWGEMIAHCGSDMLLPETTDVRSILVGHLHVLFTEVSVWVICSFLIRFGWGFLVPYTFWILIPSQMNSWQIPPILQDVSPLCYFLFSLLTTLLVVNYYL